MIGLAACIVAAIVVFGMSSFTTILTVSGIIIGLFNAFLGSSRASDDGNWFLGRIKHTLDVSNFLRIATVVIWITAIGVMAYGVRYYYHEAQKFTLAGRVLTAGGDPVASAHVILFTQVKKETITNADGTFSFVDIDPSQEPLKQVKVRVEWKNRVMEEPVNLALDRVRELKFPAGEPPFRVSYITLEGAAIDFFLRGQIDKRSEERLSGQLFIVQNSVFNSLKGLTKKFSIRMDAWEGQSFSVRNDSGEREDESLVARSVGKPFFVGSSGLSISRPASREDLLSLSN
ncbi:MAG: carboxypeptidase-like regulatory domain-containing protein, partial [Pyrinomonadaceae bacterium]